ncbi:sugar phosphate isomerase/epimerase [Schumannella luteola]|uniref:Myo-inositol catabolism protein IolH n=1 Tax=Schumannella luteola TaxID=472059 RepID=A0A852Y797_9MICO|nr:sugar phosphate isomerase/epimerase [Schumannella luteola]NYG97752.1 myo-inositol catabolism protein IolH [Schumannella luteola]TPX01385.1 sugar phosphate isomerase/epimerase [Schumannella luteola]
MVKIAYDPTPLHSEFEFLEFPRVTAELGFEWIQLTPHPDFLPFFHHPRVDRELIAAVKKSVTDAGIGISSLLPVHRISWPDEQQRLAAVRNFTRIIEIAAELDVRVINTEFSGRPEREEDSEAGFYATMEVLLPLLEREGITLNIDPHPDDFVENGVEALRIIRGLDSDRVGFVYVGSHTFHYGDEITRIVDTAGAKLNVAYAADSFDHHRSHGLRYISNPPGNAVRIHQHLNIGDGDVNWGEYFGELNRVGFLDRDDTILVSNVFAEDEDWRGSAKHQLETIHAGIAAAKQG